MSVSPLPKFSTLHLSVGRVILNRELPTIGELGRLHLTPSDMREIRDREKREKIDMAFTMVDKASLPVVSIGRVAPTAPSVVVTEAGAIVFNSFYTKMLNEMEADRVWVGRDAETGEVGIFGVKKGGNLKGIANTSLFSLTYAKKKDGTVDVAQSSLRGVQGWLRSVGYDFKLSGSQRYEGKIQDKPAKNTLVFVLPKVAPAARPKQVRASKTEKVKAVAANGASAPVVPVEDEELVLEG